MNIYHELILVFLASISAFSLAFIACAVTRKQHVPPELANSLRAQLELATRQVYHIARIAAAQEARNKAMEISLKKIEETV